MAATTVHTNHLNAVTTTQTSTPQNLSTIYPATSVTLSFANGITGPTTVAQMQVQVSDNWNGGSPTNWCNYGGPIIGPTGNSGTFSTVVGIMEAHQAVQVVFTQSSGGTAVSGTADVCTLTGI